MIDLNRAELGELIDLLDEEAERMDDDGREGAFDSSPLRPIYDKLKAALRLTPPATGGKP